MSATRRARCAVWSCASAALMPSQASTRLASPLVAFDESVSGMVVDRLEVLGLDDIGFDPLVEVEHGSYVAHHVLDELRIVVGALGDELLVRALEQAVQLARALLLDEVDDLLDPDEIVRARADGHVRALVVRAVGGDLLRAGAQARHRDDDLHRERLPALLQLPVERHFVVHQALDARYRRRLLDEIRERHLDMPFLGFQLVRHLLQHRLEVLHRDLALVRLEDLDEARHVRALEVVRQRDVHVERRDRVLGASGALHDPHRVADRLDADLVDRELARVGQGLDVRDVLQVARFHGVDFTPRTSTGGSAPATDFSIPSRSSPTDASSLAGSPCSMKRSGSPSSSTRFSIPSTFSASQTALPAPPITWCSSTVTSSSCESASRLTSSTSSGLTNRMLATVASRLAAASSAGLTIEPNARNAIRRPSRRTSPLPIGSARISGSIATPGPLPRG